jgi:hypothetical protein
MRTVEMSELRWQATVSLFCPANVTLHQRGLFVIGPPSVVAGALAGRAIGRQIARGRAVRMADAQWRVVGYGEIVMLEDRIVVRQATQFDVSVPFRTITSWEADRGGLTLYRAGWAPIRLHVNDPKSLREWFEYLAAGHLWRPPVLETVYATRPIEAWCQQDHRFTFGIPWGWFLGDPEWLRSWEADYAPARVLAGVRRMELPSALLMMVLELPPDDEINPDLIENHGDELAAHTAYFFGGAFHDPIRLIDVDGTRAMLFHVSRGYPDPMEVEQFYMLRGGRIFNGRYAVATPAGDEAYHSARPDFESMLATWHWY